MVKKTVIISVTAGMVIAAALGVLIWWLVAGRDPFTVVRLNDDALGDVKSTAAVTRIRRSGDMFWWFFPAEEETTTRPIVLWLDGVNSAPPSLAANFAMFGPYDVNLNKRNDSWVDRYNLLFVDAPLGTGFSSARSDDTIPNNLEENSKYKHNYISGGPSLRHRNKMEYGFHIVC